MDWLHDKCPHISQAPEASRSSGFPSWWQESLLTLGMCLARRNSFRQDVKLAERDGKGWMSSWPNVPTQDDPAAPAAEDDLQAPGEGSDGEGRGAARHHHHAAAT